MITASSNGRAVTASVSVASPAKEEVAAPTEAELREQVVSMVAAYARALESRDMTRIRRLYPTMSSAREEQLQKDLASMDQLAVRLIVSRVDFGDAGTVAEVTGSWTYLERGQRFTLPADNRYVVEQRGSGWVITNIR